MKRLSKRFLLNPAKIRVSGIECSFNNIVKILDALNCKLTLVTFDSITKDSSLLTLIKDWGLKCFVKSRSAEYAEISAAVPDTLLKDFLNKAIGEDPENIFVFSLPDPANSAMCIQHSYEELVNTGIVDVYISISLDENAILICMNKSLISPQDVYMKIRALRFN